MRYLIVFGILSFGVILGFLVAGLCAGRKIFELSEQVEFYRHRFDELKEKVMTEPSWNIAKE